VSDGIGKVERQLNLVSHLLRAREPVGKDELLELIDGYRDGGARDSVERKFERDKRELNALGIRIRAVAGADGDAYVIDADATLLPPVPLQPDERLLLEQVSRRYLADNPSEDNEVTRRVRSALFKLRFDNLSAPEDDEAAGGESPAATPVRSVVATESDAERRLLGTLLDAVTARQTVRFDYQKPDGSGAEPRRVDPYGVAFVRGAWYVVGHSHERGGQRVFRVSRIRGKLKRPSAPGKTDFQRPAGFNLRDVVANLLAPQDPGAVHDQVQLRVARDIAFMIADWAAQTDHAVFEADEAGGVLTLRRPLERSVQRIVAQYAPLVQVVSPPQLRAAIRDRLAALQQTYAD
jgi:predicted DNA-binding transcriptional regulator YafY